MKPIVMRTEQESHANNNSTDKFFYIFCFGIITTPLFHPQ